MDIEKAYIACMLLHAVGDTVGFKNGDWEFKRGSYEKTLEKLYEFIYLGGVNGIVLKGWTVSDDTVLHIKTALALLDEWSSMDVLGKRFKERYLEAYKEFEKEGLEKRYPGNTTLNSFELLRSGREWNAVPYRVSDGGSGASMRSLCIGLAFNGENNRDKLLQIAIESSRMTNNSAVGYLGGMTSALFTALAIERIEIESWPFLLIDLFESGKITKYIKTAGRDEEHYMTDYPVFLSKWKKYIDNKFDRNKKVIQKRISSNLVFRGRYYHENFGYKFEKGCDADDYGFIGSGGDDSVIIAYDCLMDAGSNWEKLVIYAMLHIGDTDTTGCIAAGWFGALYGLDYVPDNFVQHLEFKTELTDIAKRIYKKFGSSKY